MKQSKTERTQPLELFLDELAARVKGSDEFYLTDLNLRIRDKKDVYRAVRKVARRVESLKKAKK